MQSVLCGAAGHRRSRVTTPGFHEDRAPRNKGRRYPADPPTLEEIVAVMREVGNRTEGARLRAHRDLVAGRTTHRGGAWLTLRRQLPVGALLCVVRGATAGRHWDQSSARKQLARTAVRAGVRRRSRPISCAMAGCEMAHAGVPIVVSQRQLGHGNLGVTSIYLRRTDRSEIIDTVHLRPAPVISATAELTTKS